MVARPLAAANAFSGTVFLQGKRARASNARPYKRFSAVPRRGQDPSLQSKRKIRIKGNVPGTDKSRPAHKRQSCNNGKAAGRALGGAQRAPPVCKQTRSCGCLLHAHNPAMPGPYASVRFSLLSPHSFQVLTMPQTPKLSPQQRSRLWKKSKQARSAARPRRKASASATPPCANGCASMNPRAQTALHPGKSPATLPPRKSRPPWRSTSRAGSHCLTSAKVRHPQPAKPAKARGKGAGGRRAARLPRCVPPQGGAYTTAADREKIVRECLADGCDYGAAALKYNVDYKALVHWVGQYRAGAALHDARHSSEGTSRAKGRARTVPPMQRMVMVLDCLENRKITALWRRNTR